MTMGKSADRLIMFARKMLSFLPGGLAITGIACSGVFGAISGSSISTVVTIGSVMFPHMKKYDYPEVFFHRPDHQFSDFRYHRTAQHHYDYLCLDRR